MPFHFSSASELRSMISKCFRRKAKSESFLLKCQSRMMVPSTSHLLSAGCLSISVLISNSTLCILLTFQKSIQSCRKSKELFPLLVRIQGGFQR